MGDGVYSYMIDRLAIQLQSHISLINETEKSIALFDAMKVSVKERKEVIEKALDNLRELRESMKETITYLVKEAEGASPSEIEDLEALLEYYIEAAYKLERRTLEKVDSRIGCSGDLKALDDLKSTVLKALDVIRTFKRV